MKSKVTKKAIRENYPKIMAAGYCSMQYLLRGREPVAYSAGVYGWDCDYYEVGPLLISTGYRPARGTIATNYDAIHAYESVAMDIWGSGGDYESRRAGVETLLKKFVAEVVAK